MNPWRYVLTRPAWRDLESLDLATRQRIIDALDGLVTNPPLGDIRKLRGMQNEWRLRVGDWRVRFGRDPLKSQVVVLRIQNRKEAYRG